MVRDPLSVFFYVGTTELLGEELPSHGIHGGTYAQYASLAEASNGRLYAVPYHALRVLEIDPVARATRFIGDELPERSKYNSLAAATNGLLYAAPCHASRVLEIDPAMGTARLIGSNLPGRGRPLADLESVPWTFLGIQSWQQAPLACTICPGSCTALWNVIAKRAAGAIK